MSRDAARAILIRYQYQPGTRGYLELLNYSSAVGTAALERQARAGRERFPCCWAPRTGQHSPGCRKA